MQRDITSAKAYIEAADISGLPRGLVAQDATTQVGDPFDAAKQQAMVVGSGLFAFEVGVTPDVREAIADSALFAQLVANKKVNPETDPIEWFDEYSSALQKLGWTLLAAGWADYSTSGEAAEVHDKISEVLAVVLGPTAAAVAIVTATVSALKAMNADSPWITLFSRESQKAKIAKFQVGLVDRQTDSDVKVDLLACLVTAQKNITQVLFFKWRAEHASFKASNASVTIDRAALKELGPLIRKKTRAYQADYVSTAFDV